MEEKSNFIPLMDMIKSSSDNDKNDSEKINQEDISSQNNAETVEEDDESKQKLNQDSNNLLDINDSGIIQIPQNYAESQNQSISSETNKAINELSSQNTLDESIITTIKRDLKLIYYKLKYVLNPFSSVEDKKVHIMNWDLWGPLLFITLLSSNLSISSKQKSDVMVPVFAIFWLGSFLIYLNGNLLENKIKFFPTVCLLGYCLFPLNIAAFILSVSNFYDIINLLIVSLMCAWSLFCVEGYIRGISEKEQKILVFYPAILMFIFISWFIFVN